MDGSSELVRMLNCCLEPIVPTSPTETQHLHYHGPLTQANSDPTNSEHTRFGEAEY